MHRNHHRLTFSTSPRRPLRPIPSQLVASADGSTSTSTARPSRTTPPSSSKSPSDTITAVAPAAKPADALTHLTQFGAGALAGLVNTLVLSPLDVVKTRLQVQGSAAFAGSRHRYRSLFPALGNMLRTEGIRSYYRGLSASLWAFVPNWAIYWYTYESFKRSFSSIYATRQRRRLAATAPSTQSSSPADGRRGAHGAYGMSPLVHIASALAAGGITAVTTAPFWTLKSRLQVDMAVSAADRRYRSVLHGFRTIVAEEGVSGLYKGLTPTVLGLGHVAIQFPLYEHLKARLSRGEAGDGQLRARDVLVASSVSKIAASAIFYPHEVLRTRIQVDRTVSRTSSEIVRLTNLFRHIMKTEGARGFYRGFATNLVRTVPACMLTFTSYELAKRYADQRRGRWWGEKVSAEGGGDGERRRLTAATAAPPVRVDLSKKADGDGEGGKGVE